jgi:hypothetical protein
LKVLTTEDTKAQRKRTPDKSYQEKNRTLENHDGAASGVQDNIAGKSWGQDSHYRDVFTFHS